MRGGVRQAHSDSTTIKSLQHAGCLYCFFIKKKLTEKFQPAERGVCKIYLRLLLYQHFGVNNTGYGLSSNNINSFT